MLSYRHAFHAGNHADLLKHLVFTLVLEYYNRKDKPYICVDTHAGAACYDLGSDYALKTAEHRAGIGVLRNRQEELSTALRHFLSIIDSAVIQDDHLYPGSPLIASTLMRKQDYLRLCELHPTDVRILQQTMDQQSTVRYSISHQDGLKAALGWLPPPNRRAIVLIDPSYEVKTDYTEIPKALNNMHKRCREACILLWYPILMRESLTQMQQTLQDIFPSDHLIAEMNTQEASEKGMYGSGMFVINPPYTLAAQLEELLPELTALVAQDQTAQYKISHR